MARRDADGHDTPHDPRALRIDHWLTQTMNLAFSTSQSMAAVVVPLLAIHAGHPIEAVGLLVALSAVTQTAARLGMGSMMSRIPTKHFLIAATVLLAASCVVLGVSVALWAFVVAQLLQGAARAYFWTGAQTHVIRSSDSAVKALARLNVMQGVGQLIGPALAGMIGAWSLQVSLLAAAAAALIAIAPSFALVRFRPFASRKRDAAAGSRQIWRRPGVATAASMTAVGGAWRGILNSYLPVILTAAGYSVPMAGALITLTNLASLGGSAIAGRVNRLGARAANALGTSAAGLGLAVASLFAVPLPIVMIALAVSGGGAGILQTIGPALAADSVIDDERGRAIASIGTFRSVSLLLSPLATSALVLLLPSAAIAAAVAGIMISSPALGAIRRRTVAVDPPPPADPTQEGEADERDVQ
ncbi:MFS transporter [Microbacterium sp. KRD172]|uniref:MFS transporter n=1 Tax=Microbacterium sp. KRD172 TaxID=2729727 RepID=UPI0019D0589E|nr:MFS transporter [Microbacterium sp. KRD172]